MTFLNVKIFSLKGSYGVREPFEEVVKIALTIRHTLYAFKVLHVHTIYLFLFFAEKETANLQKENLEDIFIPRKVCD